jgi:neurotrophic tyrosine kinase receptor type 2
LAGLTNHGFYNKGEGAGSTTTQDAVPVLIRTCRNDDGEQPDKLMIQNLREALLAASLKHKNIIVVLGVVTDSFPLQVLFEFHSNGSLDQFLQKGEPGPTTSAISELRAPDLLELSVQVACGMAYLEEVGMVVKTLQAASVVVSAQNVAKITNLWGLALEADEPFRTVDGTLLSTVKWMAPEVLDRAEFSLKSDVWALGVVVWEIFSFGRQPHADTELQEVFEKAPRLRPPTASPEDVADVMERCWSPDPQHRPACHDAHKWLRDMQYRPMGGEGGSGGLANGYVPIAEIGGSAATDLNALYGTGAKSADE